MKNDILNCLEIWGGNEAADNHFRRPGLDLWIQSQPQRQSESGGSDLHLFTSCASGRITRTLLADVCADGGLFREIAGELRELLKQNINAIQQTRFVRQMSQRLDEASLQGGFASALISTYFAPTRSFNLCNAGHPPPFLFRARQRDWSVLKHFPPERGQDKAPLGVVDSAEYQQFHTTLELGDMVLSYSNSLTECCDAEGQILGLEGILCRVRQCDPNQPATLISKLANQIRGEHAANNSTEGETLLLCRCTDTGVAWRENLLAPLRIVRGVSDNTSLG